MHTFAVLISYGGPVLGVEDSQRYGAVGQTVFPGTLGQTKVCADLHPAGQSNVFPKHCSHLLRNHNLVGPHTWRDTDNQEE